MTTLIYPLLPLERPEEFLKYGIETFDAVVRFRADFMIDLDELAVQSVFGLIDRWLDERIPQKQVPEVKKPKLEWILKNNELFDFIAVDINIFEQDQLGAKAHVKLKFYFDPEKIIPWNK